MSKKITITELLSSVSKSFEAQGIQYALVGGVLSSVYRKTKRYTADVDFAIVAGPESEAKAVAIIESLDMSAGRLRAAQLAGGPLFEIKNNSTPVTMLVGRDLVDREAPGVDIILPGMPWVVQAVWRAQNNRLSFGFDPIPCITPEDFIVSKLYAINGRRDAFKDMDDLREIFENHREDEPDKNYIDYEYVRENMQKLRLSIPKVLYEFAPRILVKESKRQLKLATKSPSQHPSQ